MRIQLPKAVDEDLAADLEKQSVYVSPSVRGLKAAASRDSVDVDIADDKDPEAAAKVQRYIDTMVSRFRRPMPHSVETPKRGTTFSAARMRARVPSAPSV